MGKTITSFDCILNYNESPLMGTFTRPGKSVHILCVLCCKRRRYIFLNAMNSGKLYTCRRVFKAYISPEPSQDFAKLSI